MRKFLTCPGGTRYDNGLTSGNTAEEDEDEGWVRNLARSASDVGGKGSRRIKRLQNSREA